MSDQTLAPPAWPRFSIERIPPGKLSRREMLWFSGLSHKERIDVKREMRKSRELWWRALTVTPFEGRVARSRCMVTQDLADEWGAERTEAFVREKLEARLAEWVARVAVAEGHSTWDGEDETVKPLRLNQYGTYLWPAEVPHPDRGVLVL